MLNIQQLRQYSSAKQCQTQARKGLHKWLRCVDLDINCRQVADKLKGTDRYGMSKDRQDKDRITDREKQTDSIKGMSINSDQ